jgi:hypothetical protein
MQPLYPSPVISSWHASHYISNNTDTLLHKIMFYLAGAVTGYLLLFHVSVIAQTLNPPPPQVYDTPTSNYANGELVFAAAASCLPNQYTMNYSDPNCYSCPAGKYRSIPSQSSQAPIYGPSYPMQFEWSDAVWTYANIFAGGYGPYYPAYYTPFWPSYGGGGCTNFGYSRWIFYYNSYSIDGSACGTKTGGWISFGFDSTLQSNLVNGDFKNVKYCLDCPDLACPTGTYISYSCENGKAATCKYCAPGTITQTENQTSCQTCPAGTFNSNTGSSSCEACTN